MSLSKETMNLFLAPWSIEQNMDVFELYNCKDWGSFACTDEKNAHRFVLLPELYDTLLLCICSSCNACIYSHCGSPVDCEQLLSQDCTYEASKICFEHEARELLKKIKDGK